jgi:hypothetical protein
MDRRDMLKNLALLTGGVLSMGYVNQNKVNNDNSSVTYYVDSKEGNDSNEGTSKNSPWKTISRLNDTELNPGDKIRFKRGSQFDGRLVIRSSGTEDNYITLTDYGDLQEDAPGFTNPEFKGNNFGNCIRIEGDYVLVENLYFHDTAVFESSIDGEDGFLAIWEMGTIYVDKEANHIIIRNNELENCPVGIKSYGHHTLIEYNYIHDCNRVLKEWGWGPIGIWFGGDYQEARYNRIINYRAENPNIKWSRGTGGGADGGAFEIDDARFDKSNISIHHNYTRDNQGFLEVTWSDVKSHPDYRDFEIHHNVSDDYQQFVALWNGKNCKIDNNTIIRRKVNANDWGVFNITQDHSRNKIRNNIIITEKKIQVFNVGLNMQKNPENIIENNLFHAVTGELVIGDEGPGESPVFADPLFKNYQEGSTALDYSITKDSPAQSGGLELGYEYDFRDISIPQQNTPAIGAFELKKQNNDLHN